MGGSSHDFFTLILISSLNLISDSSYKGLKLSKAVVEESLEFILCNKSCYCAINFLVILLLMVLGPILQESSCKDDSILAGSSNSCKIVFTLLTKVIVLHMELISIYIWRSSLQ